MRKYIVHHLFSLLMSICCVIIPSCTHKSNIDKKILYITPQPIESSTAPEESPPPITLWIHGTVFFKKPSHYEELHKNPHLILATNLPEKHRFLSIAKAIVENDPENFSLKEFYIFCWSGHFSRRERKIAAIKLYYDLVKIVEAYKKKYHVYPIIRIFAHSHAGNLVLHMAKIKTSLFPLSIQSLILLACPVQEKTIHLIDTPMFQQIYSLYSSLDLVQILAPQLRRPEHFAHQQKKRGYKLPSFSSRLFPQHPHIVQTKIKIDNFPITHTRFATAEFAAMLPKILHKLDSWDNKNRKENVLNKLKLLCIYKQK